MIHVDAEAPAEAQLQSMLACFATATERPVESSLMTGGVCDDEDA